jgi:hypothetical protein
MLPRARATIDIQRMDSCLRTGNLKANQRPKSPASAKGSERRSVYDGNWDQSEEAMAKHAMAAVQRMAPSQRTTRPRSAQTKEQIAP